MKNTYKHGFILFALPLGIAIMVAAISQFMNAETQDPSALQTQKNSLPSVSAFIPSITSDIIFKESAVSKGIIFKHEHRSATLSGLADTYGSGVCIIDFNNDGYEDLFIVNGSGVTRRYGKSHWWLKHQGSRLYQNIDGQYFKDVSTKFMKDTNDIEQFSGYGCAVDDMNNDGYLDIVFGRVNQVKVLINNAGISFSQQSIPLKSDNDPNTENIWPMSITLWDWNQDGYQDVFVANFTKFKNDLRVGTKEYGYTSQIQFDSANFSGQQNIILTRNINAQNTNSFEFDLSYIDKFDRTLSITPLQLLSPIKDKQHYNSLFIANATGSNSSVYSLPSSKNTQPSSFNSMINKIKSPIVQTSQITIQEKPAVIFTQHKKGGVQVYDSNLKEQEDLAWLVGLNSEKDNASQTWASLVADLNNDGLDDFVSARGFSSPHIDSLFRPQGSKNNIKLQSSTGTFSDKNTTLIPQLSRSSRGAASVDFNNDGLIDIVFNNNNGFFSLYMNNSPINNWVSFNCEPLYLCRNSLWHIGNSKNETLASKPFSRPEPFLSANQKRVHFGLSQRSKPINLQVQLNNKKSLNFPKIDVNNTYTVNIKTNKISPITNNSAYPNKLNTPSHAFLAYLLNASLEELLTVINQNISLDEEQLVQLSQQLITYKLDDVSQSETNSAEFLTLTSWLLEQTLLTNASNSALFNNAIRLIGGSESSLFIDHLVDLIATLPEDNFCRLTNELNYWFWEEEVLPKSKQLLKSPLLHRILNAKSTNIIICGLNALSTTKDSTIGHSLVALLDNNFFNKDDMKRVQAATIRTLGYLKHATSQNRIIELCKNAQDAIINAECTITLYKFGLKREVIADIIPTPMHEQLIYKLHEDKVVLDLLISSNELKSSKNTVLIKQYQGYMYSPQKVHFELAHLVELLAAKTASERKTAFGNLLLLRTQKDIKNIILRWSQISPVSIDKYIDVLDSTNQVGLLPYASSDKIAQLITLEKTMNHHFTYNYALALQCYLRGTVKNICDEQFEISIKMSVTETEYLLKNNPINLVYALLSDNNTVKKITALRLFDLSKTLVGSSTENLKLLTPLFSMLMINDSYSLIRKSQIGKTWLAAFINFIYSNSLTLNNAWLVQFENLIDEQTKPIYKLIKQKL